VWYEGQVWGNIFAIIPAAVLGTIGYWIHKFVTREHESIDAKLERQHNEHSKHLKDILDALDPEIESNSQLDVIADRVNEETPSGIGKIIQLLESKKT
jgi:hypothetical protein